ncbi:hypothetical protein ACHAQH_006029 [Verticillium albo-atrum]
MSDNAALTSTDTLPKPSSSAPKPSSSTPKPLNKQNRRHIRYRFLSPSERVIFAQAVGAIRDPEDQIPLYPSSSSASAFGVNHGMPEGLYKDVITQRRKYLLYFHVVAFLRWAGMMMQLFVGAALTGVGAMAFHSGIPITIMAGVNTVIAGMLAMLHNSGLPDRYRINQAEFEGVEDQLKTVLNTGIVEEGQTVDQAVMECFKSYRHTRAVVASNDPSFYTSTATRRAANTEAVGEAMVVTRSHPLGSP